MAERLAVSGGKPVVRPEEHVRWPVIGASDREAVLGVLERGVLSGPFAPEVQRLEREFGQYVGARYCLATNSGTAALHVALQAAGVGPGDEVITSSFSFVATALAVLHTGAVPVFIDIEPESWGMDPAKIEAAITPRTKALLPVHIHGTPCDLDPMLAIARRHDLVLIEDAAQAHGAIYKGKKVGSIGAAGCFSLQSSKSLACGEGGLVTSSDPELIARANRARMFGEDVKLSDAEHYDIRRPLDGNRAYDSLGMGWMYRTSEMSAALGRSQLERLEHWNGNARKNAERLSRRLAELPGVTPPKVFADRTPVWHKYRVRFDARAVGVDAPATVVRDALKKALCAEGVEAVLWQTQPVPGQKLFRDKVGFGKGVPWSLGAGDVSYDLAQFPQTNALLESSLLLFSHSFPIAPQPTELVDAYADAFAKVWGQLGEVVGR